MIAADIRFMARRAKPLAKLRVDDARKCATVPDGWATLVITSPPYANNYDYADATRLEMAFMGEIRGWGDLQETVRRHLVRACSQHVPPNSVNLDEILAAPELAPIRDEIVPVCRELSSVRLERGGKKTYNNMIACYFLDMAQTWKALRRVCASPSEVCFVIGDSAPYGVYVPVIEWFGKLALAAGFDSWTFEKLRDRNIKWKNRKHRVPLVRRAFVGSRIEKETSWPNHLHIAGDKSSGTVSRCSFATFSAKSRSGMDSTLISSGRAPPEAARAKSHGRMATGTNTTSTMFWNVAEMRRRWASLLHSSSRRGGDTPSTQKTKCKKSKRR